MADEKAELCGRLLADLGADVIRLEPPAGARTRHYPPFTGDESLYFEVRNANKRGSVIDISQPHGRAELLDLLGGADIWIETTGPGQLAQYGLGPARTAEALPELVVISVTDFGHTGPFAYDMVGVSAALAATTAYLDRCNTGRGQFIDMSVMEAVPQTTDWSLTSYSVTSKIGQYGEMRDGGGKPYPIVACQDGFVRPAIVTLAEWAKLRAWIGEAGVGSEIIHQDIWEDSRTRLELFDELVRPIFVEFFQDKTMVDLATAGQQRGIPITPMLTPSGVLSAEQFDALGSFGDGVTAGGVKGRVASGFVVADGERIGWPTPAPARPKGGEPHRGGTSRDGAQYVG